MERKFIMVVVVLLAAGILPASGHHGFLPHYDPDNIVTIDGTLTRFQFRNPHSSLYIEVAGESGATEEWVCETHAASMLLRQGFSRETFTVGQEITVSGPAARRGAPGCRIYTATGADGSTVELYDGGIPVITEENAPVNESIFGDWLPVLGANTLREDRIRIQQISPNPFEDQLTEVGRAAHAEYDQVTDDPTLDCNPTSPWRVWAGSPGSPIRIERLDDRINIRFEWMDVLREVHLDIDVHPSDVARTPMGHSIGRFDTDTLVVETTAFSTGVFLPHPGVLMSPDAHLTERISLTDTGQARIAWQLDDPAYFSSPLVGEFLLDATRVQFERFDCSVEAGRIERQPG